MAWLTKIVVISAVNVVGSRVLVAEALQSTAPFKAVSQTYIITSLRILAMQVHSKHASVYLHLDVPTDDI